LESMLPFTLILPILFSFLAVKTDLFRYKILVTASCILIIVLSSLMSQSFHFSGSNPVFYLLGAFSLSIVGDYFLSFRKGKKNYYLFGILGFFAAHIFYLVYALQKSPSLLQTIVYFLFLVSLSIIYFRFRIVKHLPDLPMKIAVFFYLFISCLTFSVSLTCVITFYEHLLLSLGIGLIFFSDLCIAENDFVGNQKFYRFRSLKEITYSMGLRKQWANPPIFFEKDLVITFQSLILPTYYLSHILLTSSILLIV